MDSLTASGENAKIAKDVLVSLVEESAIVDMTAMEDMLSQFLTTADASNVGGMFLYPCIVSAVDSYNRSTMESRIL